MIIVNLNVNPGTDEEAVTALTELEQVTKSLGLKGISVSLSINSYAEEKDEE
jgi:hypothetical protein